MRVCGTSVISGFSGLTSSSDTVGAIVAPCPKSIPFDADAVREGELGSGGGVAEAWSEAGIVAPDSLIGDIKLEAGRLDSTNDGPPETGATLLAGTRFVPSTEPELEPTLVASRLLVTSLEAPIEFIETSVSAALLVAMLTSVEGALMTSFKPLVRNTKPFPELTLFTIGAKGAKIDVFRPAETLELATSADSSETSDAAIVAFVGVFNTGKPSTEDSSELGDSSLAAFAGVLAPDELSKKDSSGLSDAAIAAFLDVLASDEVTCEDSLGPSDTVLVAFVGVLVLEEPSSNDSSEISDVATVASVGVLAPEEPDSNDNSETSEAEIADTAGVLPPEFDVVD